MFGERKYYEDYVVEVVEKNGKPKKRSTYIGGLYKYVSPALAMRLKIYLAVAAVFLVALFSVSGVLTFSNDVYYVLVPFAAQALTLAMYIFSVVELFVYGGSLRTGDKRRTLDRIRPVVTAHAILAFFCVPGDIFFVIFDPKFEEFITEFAFMMCNTLAAVIALLCTLAVRDIKMRETVNPEKDRIERQRAEQIKVNEMLEKEKRQQASAAAAENYRKNKKR